MRARSSNDSCSLDYGYSSSWASRSFHLVDPGSALATGRQDRKSTRLNSSHVAISYAVFNRVLHSFPTRRSSDLSLAVAMVVSGLAFVVGIRLLRPFDADEG